MTAYLSIAAALRDLAEPDGATHMSITITLDRGIVLVVVAGDGCGEPHGVTDMGDRIGAAGGRLDVAPAAKGLS
jgi:signal transduction histidine kinase